MEQNKKNKKTVTGNMTRITDHKEQYKNTSYSEQYKHTTIKHQYKKQQSQGTIQK